MARLVDMSLYEMRLRVLTATSADKVMTTNGAAGSIFLTAFSLCNLGDEVVTVVPNFPPTMDIISAIGATKKTIPLSLPMKNMNSALKDYLQYYQKAPDSVIFVTPHNPSGMLTQKTIKTAINLIQQKSPKAYILIDESFSRSNLWR